MKTNEVEAIVIQALNAQDPVLAAYHIYHGTAEQGKDLAAWRAAAARDRVPIVEAMEAAVRITARTFGEQLQRLRRLPQCCQAWGLRAAFMLEERRRREGRLPAGWRPLSSSPAFLDWFSPEHNS